MTPSDNGKITESSKDEVTLDDFYADSSPYWIIRTPAVWNRHIF